MLSTGPIRAALDREMLIASTGLCIEPIFERAPLLADVGRTVAREAAVSITVRYTNRPHWHD
jgi:hypothetical protein